MMKSNYFAQIQQQSFSESGNYEKPTCTIRVKVFFVSVGISTAINLAHLTNHHLETV